MQDFRLILALERKRTTDTFGTHHYCKSHNQIVDTHHIDDCSHLKLFDHPISEVVKILQGTNCIWDLELQDLTSLQRKLQIKQAAMQRLEGKEYLKVKASRVQPDTEAP